MLSGILFVLVLLEKSMATNHRFGIQDISKTPNIEIPSVDVGIPKKSKDFLKDEPWAKNFEGFKNIGPGQDGEIPIVEIPHTKLPSASLETNEMWEENVKSEIDELIPDEEIPILDSQKNLSYQEHTNIYFIKFFGSDNKSSSRLVRVPRIIPRGKDPVQFVLEELKKGPRPEESSKGVLNSLPDGFSYSKSYQIQDGILHLDLDSRFEYGGGPEIIQDRMDQLAHSLIGVSGIRGVKITINNKKVSSLGGDGVPLPKVLGKRDRRITTL